MVTVVQLRDCEPGLWTAAGDEFVGRSELALASSKDLWESVVHPLGEWAGSAGEAARQKLQSFAERLEVDSLEFRAIGYVNRGLGHAFRISRNTLLGALDSAAADGFRVSDDGVVSLPQDPMIHRDPELHRLFRDRQQQLTAMIDAAITGATNADLRSHDLLIRLSTRTDLSTVSEAKDVDLGEASATEVALIAGVVPHNRSTVVAWWAGLPVADQQMLLQAVPWELEDLSGLPPEIHNDLHGPGDYDHTGVADWARHHWIDNSDDPFEDNCTNFASNALEAGGVEQRDLDFLGYNGDWQKGSQSGWRLLDEVDYSHSPTWAQAQDSYEFWAQHGTELDVADARPGDLIYWEQADTGHDIAPGTVHHAAVVTSTLDGDVRYTQHSTNQLDASLEGRSGVNEIDGGRQKIHVVRPSPDW